MRLEDKPVDTIPFSQKSLTILLIMLICDFGVQPKERREKRVLRVGGINVNWRFRYDGCHILKRDGSGSTVIEEYSVRRRRSGGVGSGRNVGNWNVHVSTSQKHVRSRVNAFDSSTRRIYFLDERIFITVKRAENTTVVFQVLIDGTLMR
jgi:hypothetical protein